MPSPLPATKTSLPLSGDETTSASSNCAIRVNVASFLSEGNLELLLKKDLGIERFEAVFKKKNNDRGVITFTNPADKAVAVSILSSATRKDGKSYKVQDVEYVEESRTHKRQRETAVELLMRKRARVNGGGASETRYRSVSEVVTPWVDVPYYEQLDRKVTIVLDALTRTLKSLRKDYKQTSSRYPDLDLRGVARDSSFQVLLYSPDSLKVEKQLTPVEMRLEEKKDLSADSAVEEVEETKTHKVEVQNGARVICPLEVVAGWTPSGVVGYRNKLEFSIGRDEAGETAVGYMCGRHSEGWPIIGRPQRARNTPDIASKLALLTEKIVQSSGFAPFVQVRASDKASGVWRRLMVRLSHAHKELMVLFTVDGSALSDDQKTALQNYVLKELPPQYLDFAITNVIWQSYSAYSNAVPDDTVCEVLRGPGSIIESLHGFSFQIQPASFFQVNSAGGSVLYDLVRQFIGNDAPKNAVLADICCGTGTIGITLSKRFKRVVGFELVASAVADAEANSQLNSLQNCTFICGKAEETLPEFVKTLNADERLVAVVDPPRAGLHKHVIRALRACAELKTLVYVSCNPSTMAADVAALLRPEGKKRPGQPFKPVRCGVVDMFPDTMHCECVLLLERE